MVNQMEDPLPMTKMLSQHLQIWCGKSCVGTFPAVLLPTKGRLPQYLRSDEGPLPPALNPCSQADPKQLVSTHSWGFPPRLTTLNTSS